MVWILYCCRCAYTHVEYAGVQLALCTYCLIVYNSLPEYKRWRPYLVITFLILGLFVVMATTDSVFAAEMIINNSTWSPEYFEGWKGQWYGLLGTFSSKLINVIGDGLLVRTGPASTLTRPH